MGERAGLAALAIAIAGCAHHASQQATSGALHTFAEEVGTNEPGQRPMEAIAGRAVSGALDRLDDPEEIARVRALVAIGARQAGESISAAIDRRLIEDLGRDGRGPLGASVTALARNATGAATSEALRRLTPGCAPDDAACVDRRVAELSRHAAAAFMHGVREELGLWALALAFLAGGLVAIGALLLRELLRARHARAPEPRPAPMTPHEQAT